jgi:cullin-associated NEDD8-dissociated protein 1
MHCFDAGNAGENQAVLDVKCWDQKSVVVKVIDICPCWYEPKGMNPYFQYGCCYKQQRHPKAGQLNLDLSFWVSCCVFVECAIASRQLSVVHHA